ncbi:uncharacterized protein [Temnothorax longispinosus]|uniref:Putative nuclease HARBI1 n=1 Tax=Temnothorax longispinosus TaxID=300112 RepID=A0A4S2K9B2_9HYME|nr:putative nuclease HARBI1 [Temnothorax longispinosus]
MNALQYTELFKSMIQMMVIENNKRRTARLLKIIHRRQQVWKRIHLQIKRSLNLIMNVQHQMLLPPMNLAEFCFVSNRRLWMKRRSYHFWDDIVLNTYDDAQWLESFRMRKDTFNKLCDIVKRELEPKPIFLKSREPLSVQKQVAVALYKLASCAEYRVVGNIFGIHKSTVKKCLYKVVNAINNVMMADYLHMPNEFEAVEIANNFEKRSHIPQIIGCIDGSHIPILAPADGYRDYVNRKGWPSYNLQAVVDDKCRFRDICIRHPGNTHDAAVFKDSNLYKNVHTLIPQSSKNIDGMEVPYLIIGDPAYPLLPWLIKGYPGSVTPEQDSFNVHLNSARVAVEMAFGRLRGRWRILLKRLDVSHTFVPNITSACCILHNFLEYTNEHFVQQWFEHVADAEILFPQPGHVINRERNNILGSDIRQHLTTYLSQNFPLRRSMLR